MAELFIPSNTARVLLVDENGVPYKAGSGGGSVTTQVNGVNTSDQTLVNFVDTPSVTWANPSGGIIEATAPGGGSGDVVGPASAIDNDIAVFNGATGKIIKDGGTTIAAINSAIAGKQAAGNYITALTGDVTASGPGSVTATLANIPTATPAAGTILHTAIAAPSTPAAGKGAVYVDSTSKNLAVKDDAGVVKHGVQTQSSASSTFLTAINDAGAVSTGTAVTSINKAGSTALIGAVTLTGGTNVTLTQSGQDISIAASGGGGGTVTWSPPMGMRLSATNNVYIPTSVIAATTLYWTPRLSGGTGVVTGYNGSALATKTVQQKSIVVTIGSGKIKNVYYDYDGDVLVLGADWTNDTTPSETLADEQGAVVLSTDHTLLYLGVIAADGTDAITQDIGGTTSQTGGKQFVWNAWNQVEVDMLVIDTTDSWTYTTNTWRQENGASGNKVEYVTGDIATVISATYLSSVFVVNSSGVATVGIGVDSTSAPSGFRQAGYNANGAGTYSALGARYIGKPGIGKHTIYPLEKGNSATNMIFVGDNGGDGQQTGLSVSLQG